MSLVVIIYIHEYQRNRYFNSLFEFNCQNWKNTVPSANYRLVWRLTSKWPSLGYLNHDQTNRIVGAAIFGTCFDKLVLGYHKERVGWQPTASFALISFNHITWSWLFLHLTNSWTLIGTSVETRRKKLFLQQFKCPLLLHSNTPERPSLEILCNANRRWALLLP